MTFRIGRLARETGCQIETIRYYERIGVLPLPPRGENNYRYYDDAHRRRLLFVRRLRELGFSLEEVRVLLRLIDGGEFTCAEIRELGAAHLRDVRRKIDDLRAMETALADLVGRCSGAATPDCSMLEALFEPPIAPPVPESASAAPRPDKPPSRTVPPGTGTR